MRRASFRIVRFVRAILLAGLAGFSAGACDALFGPDVTGIEITPANPEDLVSLGSTVQFEARAVDENGRAVADVSIAWGTSDIGVVSVDGSGLATAAGNGTATLTATAVDEDGVSADVQVTVRQEPTAVVVQSGGGQTGLPGAQLPDPIRLRVEDARGNPVEGVLVEFTIQSGGGTMLPAEGSTNAAGELEADWVLGDDAIDQSVLAAAEGLAQSVPITATVDMTRVIYLDAPASASPGDVIDVVLTTSLEGLGSEAWGAIIGSLEWSADALQPLSISTTQGISVQAIDGATAVSWAASRPTNSASDAGAATLSFEVQPTTAAELTFDVSVTEVYGARTLNRLTDALGSLDATMVITP